MGSLSDTTVHSSERNVLVIMAKAPRPGAVKTRLAPCLSLKDGAQRSGMNAPLEDLADCSLAWRRGIHELCALDAVSGFYCCLLDDTLALARSLSDVEVAIMCPDSDADELAELAGAEASIVAQKGEGLAAALTSVFAYFAKDHQRVIAFNSDSPHLPRSVLEGAFETLAQHDLVVGPTHDGGYYLVGAKAPHPTLFARDGMSTSSALDRLLWRARALELSVGLVDPFYDIDVADDLTRLAAELRLAPDRAPRTAAWLKEWERATGTA
jgi:uncharacterized protein